jgi:signal transduction histidine kinase
MYRILVIEDDDNTRECVVHALSQNFTIIEADDGPTGLELAQQYIPDVIICDIALPGLDGYEILKALREQESTATVSFLFLTGFNDRLSVRRAMGLGADDFLSKPFTVEELTQAVEARLNKKRVREAALSRTVEQLRQNISLSLPHELRTAIMVIEGYIYLLLENLHDTNSEEYKMLTAVGAGTERLHRLAEKFLWYAKTHLIEVKHSAREITPRPDNLICQIAIEQAALASRTSDLSLQLAVAPVQISTEYLSKILEEVIENAFKFSSAGTAVSVRAQQHDNIYLISIMDQGRGMTPDQINKIGAFVQFEREYYEQQGAGLGLAIAKRLIEVSGGQINIHSTPCQGTVISIHLPCELAQDSVGAGALQSAGNVH